MRFSIFQDTALGARSVNQDRMGYCFTRDSVLMVVADGMGGHLRGEVAAQIALQSIGSVFQSMAKPALPDPVAFLDDALRRGHRDILKYQLQYDLPESPRTTIVACVIQGGTAWWAHAGDSRLYLLRGDGTHSRTRDHSKVESMLAMGLLQPGEQDTHPERNKVLNCLGSPFEPTVEIGAPVKLQTGDKIVLCSDGFWSAIPETELARSLAQGSLHTVIPQLIKRAVELHGRMADNTTALALAWEGESEGQGMSSLDVPEGAITTTIAMGQPEVEEGTDITEDEIEQTIREIRSAIEKTGGR